MGADLVYLVYIIIVYTGSVVVVMAWVGLVWRLCVGRRRAICRVMVVDWSLVMDDGWLKFMVTGWWLTRRSFNC